MSSKADLSDKAFSSRKIMFPSEIFVELTLSPSQVRKVRRWIKEGSEPAPMWYANSKRVVFVNAAKFKEWEKR